jgi:hypothetical protein
MRWQYNSNYPSIDDLIKRAKKKIPKFAFEYLDGGCNEDVNLYKILQSGKLDISTLKSVNQPGKEIINSCRTFSLLKILKMTGIYFI